MYALVWVGVFGWLMYFCRECNRWCLAEFYYALSQSYHAGIKHAIEAVNIQAWLFSCRFVDIFNWHVNGNNFSRTCIEFISYVVHHVFVNVCHYVFGWSYQLLIRWNSICCCLRKLIFSTFIFPAAHDSVGILACLIMCDRSAVGRVSFSKTFKWYSF